MDYYGCFKRNRQGNGIGGVETRRRGDNAVITAKDTKRLKDVVDLYPKNAYAAVLEVTDAGMCKSVVDAAVARFGTVDVLLNNAGRGYHCPVEDSGEAEIRLLFETNYFGPVRLTQAVLPIMRKQGSGIIANVSSMGVHFQNTTGNAFYTSSKAALDEFSKVLRNEVKPFGIQVTVIEPGAFRTGFRTGGLAPKGERNSAYLETAYASADDLKSRPHDQPGDPEKAGKIIVDTLCGKTLPKYLVLGSGMVEAEVDALKARIEEVEKCVDIVPLADYEE